MSEELYNDLLLTHWKKPAHAGRLSGPGVETGAADNPLCGDSVLLDLRRDAAGTIREVAFESRGCAICQATASMMCEALLGRTEDEARTLAEGFLNYIEGGECPPELNEGPAADLKAIRAVMRAPIRKKCARLPWQALDEILNK